MTSTDPAATTGPPTAGPGPGEPAVPDVLVRPGAEDDTDEVAALLTAARVAAVPQMPPSVHTPQEDRAWMALQLAGEREAWVAERDGRIAGFMLLEDDWLHSLYVHPGLTGQGTGTLLLEVAKSLRPDGLQLWVFETNLGARRLYERHGFVVVERTDGSGNEERAPDLRMVWRGRSAQV